MFSKNVYSNWYFENALRKFEDREKKAEKDKGKEICVELAYHIWGKPSHKFAKRLSTLVKTKFQIDLSFYYTSHARSQLLMLCGQMLYINLHVRATQQCHTSV